MILQGGYAGKNGQKGHERKSSCYNLRKMRIKFTETTIEFN
jgi:hypothetical protein